MKEREVCANANYLETRSNSQFKGKETQQKAQEAKREKKRGKRNERKERKENFSLGSPIELKQTFRASLQVGGGCCQAQLSSSLSFYLFFSLLCCCSFGFCARRDVSAKTSATFAAPPPPPPTTTTDSLVCALYLFAGVQFIALLPLPPPIKRRTMPPLEQSSHVICGAGRPTGAGSRMARRANWNRRRRAKLAAASYH